MKFMAKSNAQRGEANMSYILVGIAVAICVFAAVKYFQDRNNDITIHMPKVEVH